VDPLGLQAFQPCEDGQTCTWNDNGCTVDGMSVPCNLAEQWAHMPGGGGIAPCAGSYCGGKFQWDGFQYTLSAGANGWFYTNDQNGEELSIGGILELGLPDMNNQAPPGSPLRQEVQPAYGPLSAQPPGHAPFKPPAPGMPLAQITSSVQYSQSYLDFLSCEFERAAGDSDQVKVTLTVNLTPLALLGRGNVLRAAWALLPMAAYDIGGAWTINRACSTAVYGQ